MFVVTHPEATHHVESRVGGWFDSALTARGHEHAHRIADAISERVGAECVLYASDLRRTAQTANAIASRIRNQPHYLAELREKSYGAGEGRTDAWFRERFVPPPQYGERLDHDEGLPGAETKAQWVHRVYAGMDTVMSNPAKQQIVTHGGTASMVVAYWIRMPVSSLTHVSFRVAAGSITHLREDDYFHNRTVESLNEIGHISD